MKNFGGTNQLRLKLFKTTQGRHRQMKSLLDPTSDVPPFKLVHVHGTKKLPTRYRPVKSGSPNYYKLLANNMLLDKKKIIPASYDTTNCHELDGSFRFCIDGYFQKSGIPFSFWMKRLVDELALVGFLLQNSKRIQGEVQGDVYALADIKKWLTNGEASSSRGNISSVFISHETTGLQRVSYPLRH